MPQAKEIKYRGYSVRISGQESSWHFAATPDNPDLRLLRQSEFTAAALTEDQALQDAKQRIDRLLD